VPFPFTDLSATKRRPALVVSPDGFHPDDFILCAISSQLSTTLGPWTIRLEASDLLDASLPKPSVILVGKLFTMHRGLVAGQFGRVTPAKQRQVLERLTRLFGRPNP
jgi:mRNA interferase MazF